MCIKISMPEFIAITISHGLTYVLLSDFPIDHLEDKEFAELCAQGKEILGRITQKMEENARVFTKEHQIQDSENQS